VEHPRPRPTATGGSQSTVEIALHEGRKHQVRRMFEAVGHPVVRLRRIRIGPIQDESLATGHYRDLTAAELAALRRSVLSR
jgi:23S rRNA pseudouridine2605 synthase